jgi:transaldolase
MEGTIAEAKFLWNSVDRPNLLIKVPATIEGIGAIEKLIGEGISVNVNLLFSVDRYLDVVEAYLSGLESRHKRGQSIHGLASVASFFLSRIDVLVNSKLPPGSKLRGEIAIASTSSKDPLDSDIKYIEALIGPETINTIPLDTLNAYRDHGQPANRLGANLSQAILNLELLKELKVDLGILTQQLENEGVQKFTLSYDKLLSTLENKCRASRDLNA